MKVSLDSLDEEIKKELENFNAEVINAANDSFQETAKEAAEMLKKRRTVPGKNRSIHKRLGG